MVRVKLFSLVFVRTHRLVSEGERERERAREGDGKRRENEEKRGRGRATENGREERARGEKERGVARRGRKIGRSTILLVWRRASKQNAWSTSELFPFPSSSPVSSTLPFRPPSAASFFSRFPPPKAPRRSLDGTNYYPSQVHFFLFPRSYTLRALPRFTPKRPPCDKKLRELGSATLRLAQLPATRVNLCPKCT